MKTAHRHCKTVLQIQKDLMYERYMQYLCNAHTVTQMLIQYTDADRARSAQRRRSQPAFIMIMIMKLVSVRGRIQHRRHPCLSESDPPQKNHRASGVFFLKNILKHFKHCPDQICDQKDDNAEEPRSNPSLQQYSEFRQILRILQH
jgi:hypothetical protein